MLIMTDNKSIGERIKELRKKNLMTLDVLAQKSTVSKTALSNYENNKISPSGLNCYKIAKVLGVSMEYILTGDASEGFVVNGDNNFQVGHGNTSYGYGSKQHTVKSDEQSSEIKRLNDEIMKLNNVIMALNDEIKQEKDKRLELMEKIYMK
jgi:transcriptional regulator with XRE-family HTH domain